MLYFKLVILRIRWMKEWAQPTLSFYTECDVYRTNVSDVSFRFFPFFPAVDQQGKFMKRKIDIT